MHLYNPKHYSIVRVSQPASEPVSLAEAKLWCKQTVLTEDDAIFTSLITSAREQAEIFCNRKFINQQFIMYLDAFSNVFLTQFYTAREDFYGAYPVFSTERFPFPKLYSVDLVQYYDLGQVLQTLPSNQYIVDTASEYGRMTPAYNATYPTTLAIPNAVKITFTAGWGPDATFVPESIKTAIKQMVANWYDHRSEVSETQKYIIPNNARRSLSAYRVLDIGSGR